MLGDTLGGRYLLSGLLGAGGMAEVFLAHDRMLGRDLALKVLKEHYAKDCLLYTSPSPRDRQKSRMPSSA